MLIIKLSFIKVSFKLQNIMVVNQICVSPVVAHGGTDDLARAAPLITRGALTFPSPIRACVETDCSSLSENRRRWLGEVVQLVGLESHYGRKLQVRSPFLSSSLLSGQTV